MNTFYTDDFWGLDYPPTPQPHWLFEDLNSEEKDWDMEDDDEEANYWSPYEWFN